MQLGLRPADLLSLPRSQLTTAGLYLSTTIDRIITAARAADPAVTPSPRCRSAQSDYAIMTHRPSRRSSLSLSGRLGVDAPPPRTASVENLLRLSARRISAATTRAAAPVDTEAELELLAMRKRLYGLREKVGRIRHDDVVISIIIIVTSSSSSYHRHRDHDNHRHIIFSSIITS